MTWNANSREKNLLKQNGVKSSETGEKQAHTNYTQPLQLCSCTAALRQHIHHMFKKNSTAETSRWDLDNQFVMYQSEFINSKHTCIGKPESLQVGQARGGKKTMWSIREVIHILCMYHVFIHQKDAAILHVMYLALRLVTAEARACTPLSCIHREQLSDQIFGSRGKLRPGISSEVHVALQNHFEYLLLIVTPKWRQSR